MNRPLLLAWTGVWLTAATAQEAAPERELLIQSGFEGTCEVLPIAGTSRHLITGRDPTLAEPNDWQTALAALTGRGGLRLEYTGGEPSQRFARIIPEPGNPTNHVLWFWLNDSWVADGGKVKARVQADLYGLKQGLREFSQAVRVFLTADWAALRRYPRPIGWLTIAEFWNNQWWGSDPHGFRVTLGIGKPTAAESDLCFILDAQDAGFKQVWEADNHEVKVPIGQWFTMEFTFREGDAATGRFQLAITPEGQPRQVVFDVTNYTHHTADPAPGGLTEYNPLKLYTSKEVVAYMRSQGRTLQVYWDDFRLWRHQRP